MCKYEGQPLIITIYLYVEVNELLIYIYIYIILNIVYYNLLGNIQ